VLPVESWTVFYADDSTFTSSDGDPEDAPLDGVLVIIDETHGRRIVQGHDYYAWIDGEWAGGMRADLDRWIRAGYVHPGSVKFGLYVGSDHYRQVVERAMSS
jgi:hypothetical protein